VPLNPLIAAGGIVSDRMETAPDRIGPAAFAVDNVTAAYAGAALALQNKRVVGQR
jgi:uncharacterized membrane protein